MAWARDALWYNGRMRIRATFILAVLLALGAEALEKPSLNDILDPGVTIKFLV